MLDNVDDCDNATIDNTTSYIDNVDATIYRVDTTVTDIANDTSGNIAISTSLNTLRPPVLMSTSGRQRVTRLINGEANACYCGCEKMYPSEYMIKCSHCRVLYVNRMCNNYWICQECSSQSPL